MPGSRIRRRTVTLVNRHWSAAITRRNDNLRKLAGLEFRRFYASAILGKLCRQEFVATEMLEPVVTREQIDLAIAIHIKSRDPFCVFQRAAFACAAGKNFRCRPRSRAARVSGNFREQQFLRALVPECQLCFARPRSEER